LTAFYLKFNNRVEREKEKGERRREGESGRGE
jgi:hypothetical protein